jgi:hypothetical protein
LALQPLTKAQIGKCGELLVQQRLLKYGIESSPMATDAGIDLVAFSAVSARARTIQIKTNLRAKPGGGKGPLALDWWMPENSPAEYFALVDLESDGIWLFSREEMRAVAQQKPEGRLHFYMYVDAAQQPRRSGCHIREFGAYRIENKAAAIFGLQLDDSASGSTVRSASAKTVTE